MTESRSPRRLGADEVCRRIDPATLGFATTAEVEPITGTAGQHRALEAIEFGLETPSRGFNLYVAGSSGTGREDTVMAYVREYADQLPSPPDWIYVHNFEKSDEPIAISLPAGQGQVFAAAMTELVQTMQREIPRALESEEVQNRRRALVALANDQRVGLLEQMSRFAGERDFSFEMQPTGFVTAPLIDGKPIPPDDFKELPADTRATIQRKGEEINAEMASTLRHIRTLDRETLTRLQELERDVVGFVTGPLFEELREEYQFNEEAMAYLVAVESDLPEHLHDFWPVTEAAEPGAPAELLENRRSEHLGRYEVNVLVDNGDSTGAPVVFERNPTFANLLGRMEYRAVFGAMVTDFRQIKAGALHRANGGFLIAHVVDILRNPLAWETLKRVLISGEVEIEAMSDQFSAIHAGRLRPEPIPARVKVVLIGPRNLYQTLFQLDDDFAELFSVRADFAPDMTWNEEHVADYAAFISRKVREDQLLHFDAGAVGRVVEFGATQREHQGKITSRFLDIANLITEATHWARKAGHDPVTAENVETAIAKRTRRSNLIEERFQELIEEQTLTISTSGNVVGQVNGLSVIDLGDYSFGRPTRISARVSPGKGAIQSIDRDIELSGPIHSKGFMILSGYLRGQYGGDAPLSLSATLAFEQTYEMIDGDSASSTELYALLSALAAAPLDQGIAVTGSVDQFGRVQAVGGVTRKIEGFFDVCRQQGLTGKQGVIVPASNIRNLMLNREVAAAIAKEQFHVWAVESIDQGIALLTGVEEGSPNEEGEYPAESIHGRVARRLARYRELTARMERMGEEEHQA